MITLHVIHGNAPFWRPAGGQITQRFRCIRNLIFQIQSCIWNFPLHAPYTLLQQLAVNVTTG